MPDLTAKKIYDREEKKRKQFVDRARKNAEFTDPFAFPDVDIKPGSDTEEVQPWQGLGARGVRILSSKIMLALYPANTPWFRQQVEPDVLDVLKQANPNAPALITAALSKMENIVTSDYEASNTRPIDSESVRQLIIAGNVCQFQDDEGQTSMFRLNEYITIRDKKNKVKLGIIKETMSVDDFNELDEDRKPAIDFTKAELNGKKDLEMYTVVKRLGKGKWTTWQEIKEKEVPESRKMFKEDSLPWFFLQAIPKPGWNYGEAIVTEVIADLVTFDSLSQSITEATAAGAMIINMVKPNGQTEIEDLQNAQNGDYIEGDEADVGTLQTNKALDLRTAQSLLESIQNRISQFFLMAQNSIRNAERVTREEIRLIAQELEQALGGTYSQWATEWQLPRVKYALFRLQRKRKLPQLPKGATKPIIITGLDALGRGHKLNKLQSFIIEDLQVIAGIDPSLIQGVKGRNLLTELAAARGLDISELLMSEEELAALQEQARAQAETDAFRSAAGGKAIDTAGNIAEAAAVNAVTS